MFVAKNPWLGSFGVTIDDVHNHLPLLAPSLPLYPLEPDVPDVPLAPSTPFIPLVPALPLEPELPDVPELPEEPAEPELPDVPLVPSPPETVIPVTLTTVPSLLYNSKVLVPEKNVPPVNSVP